MFSTVFYTCYVLLLQLPVATKQSLHVSPVANHTRSKARQTGLSSFSSSEHAVTPVSSKEPTATDLSEPHPPVSLWNVTKYHEDFVKCEDQATANRMMESMQDQWLELAKPGHKVKVKMKKELIDAIIEKLYFILKPLLFLCYCNS